jgi:hypothetical protein
LDLGKAVGFYDFTQMQKIAMAFISSFYSSKVRNIPLAVTGKKGYLISSNGFIQGK